MDPNAEAFTKLYLSNYRTLVRYAYLRVNDRALAEDLADDAFLLAWEKAPSPEAITSRWLFATVRNLIGNEYQRRDRERIRVQQAGMEEAASVEAWGLHIEQIGLRLAMSRLRPEDSLVLQLTYWHGLSAAEAAQFLDCTVAALWVRLTRARAALRALLDDTSIMPTRRRARGGDVRG
ncbi:MAG: sigma-70 family RNA polymerase sigma factor [Microbacterium sp.]